MQLKAWGLIIVEHHLEFCLKLVFTALRGMQMRSSNENSVRLSIRLSNVWIVTKRKKNRSRILHHTKDHLA